MTQEMEVSLPSNEVYDKLLNCYERLSAVHLCLKSLEQEEFEGLAHIVNDVRDTLFEITEKADIKL
jgi:hypothetical protein